MDSAITTRRSQECGPPTHSEKPEMKRDFLLLMKFPEWEKCVEAAATIGADAAENCRKITSPFFRCMEEHGDYYYEPIFKADSVFADKKPVGHNREREEVQTIPLKTPTTLTSEFEVIQEPDLEEGGGEEEAEEEMECGFCLFMKGGGCKEPFIAWEKCMQLQEAEETGEEGVVVEESCHEITSLLKNCMVSHADYYEPILKAEKAMGDRTQMETKKEMEVKELV